MSITYRVSVLCAVCWATVCALLSSWNVIVLISLPNVLFTNILS